MKRSNYIRTGLELLETREVMSSAIPNFVPIDVAWPALIPDPTVTLQNGVLRIDGTAFSDQVNVGQVIVGGSFNHPPELVLAVNWSAEGRSKTFRFPNLTVSQVVFFGGNGDDQFTSNLISPIEAHGGAGNDTLNGNTANDQLFGEDGNDTLYGKIGNDTIQGGAGVDSLYGEGGNDVVWGGMGEDFISGGTGTDTLLGNDLAFEQRHNNEQNIEYDRFSDVFDPTTWVVTNIHAMDIDQNRAESCSVLSSLAAAANAGVDLAGGISYLGNSQYRVRLYENGNVVHETVTFDGTWNPNETNPTRARDPYTGDPNGAMTGEYWHLLYERAYLQRYIDNWQNPDIDTWRRRGATGDAAVGWGDCAHSLSAFTGRNTSTTYRADLGAPTSLQNSMRNHDAVVAQFSGHIVAVTNVYQDSAGVWMVQIYNQRALDISTAAYGAEPDGFDDGVMTIKWDVFKTKITYIATARA